MIKIGVTGGICTGKSTLMGIFSSLGVPVWSADAVVAACYESDPQFLMLLQGIYNRYGISNKEQLKALIPKNPKILSLLEDFLHPKVHESLSFFCAKWLQVPVIACEIPLLYEADLAHFFDRVWVTNVSKKVQMQRFLARPKGNLKTFQYLQSKQLSQQTKCEKADLVLDMDRPMPLIEGTVKSLLNGLTNG